MKSAEKIVKEVFRKLGLEISRYRPETSPAEAEPPGSSPLSDIKRLTRSHPLVVFDVGANIGQSAWTYQKLLPQSEIHSFEPSPATYKALAKNIGSRRGIYLNNLAVGSSCGRKMFFENHHPEMSSFLRPGESCWGEVVKETEVEVITLDRYCEEKGIPHISLLKTDTQGYDFEVLKGADGLMRGNRIELIFMEVIFSAMYQDLPAFDEVYRFLLDRGFKLVSFYQFHYQQEMASWSDALFLNTSFGSRRDAA
ncbi:MAG: FkbM family methyltransferase [Acidobacteriota bacterium]|nr:FkbM family methyltransferase [Acidobacteriota bacterium]